MGLKQFIKNINKEYEEKREAIKNCKEHKFEKLDICYSISYTGFSWLFGVKVRMNGNYLICKKCDKIVMIDIEVE